MEPEKTGKAAPSSFTLAELFVALAAFAVLATVGFFLACGNVLGGQGSPAAACDAREWAGSIPAADCVGLGFPPFPRDLPLTPRLS